MTLSITNIQLNNFRNYARFDLDDIGQLTIFVGPNAIGKTNIIEAVQLLTACHSFRNPTSEQLVYRDAIPTRNRIQVADASRHLDIEFTIHDGHRKFLLNSKPKRSHELRGLVPSVVFTPDDLEIIKRSHSVRRTALDHMASQLSKNYHVIKKDYDNVIHHKNALLKDGAADALVDSINEMLITCGAQLCAYRSALWARFHPLVSRHYAEITDGGEELEVCYVPSWVDYDSTQVFHEAYSKEEARAALEAALAEHAGEERARGRAVIGPHADKIDFYINGRNAAVYGSQGQQRSIVLVWKLAEVDVIEEVLGQQPILLLDDVMSELDDVRRAKLMDIALQGPQAFVTTTTLSYFTDDVLQHAKVVHLPLNAEAGE